MADPRKPGPARSNIDDTTFTRRLRYEFAGEEGRAVVGSYALSLTFAALFLLLVYLTPPPRPPEIALVDELIEVEFEEPPPEPEPEPEAAAPAPAPTPTPRPQPAAAAAPVRNPQQARDAFGGTTGGAVGDVSGLLRGVDVATGSGDRAVGTGSKTVLAEGAGGVGSARTPGRGGVTGGDAGIGTGVSGRGVTRGAVRVSAPAVTAPPVTGPGRDIGALGNYVRSRTAELQHCYQEHGLKVNPRLAGTIRVAITIASSGAVTNANITSRTWSGPGVSAAESCIIGRIRAWRFPSAEAGEGTYTFPFNFTT